ncbi:MAG: signal peptidase II [Clostridia bacterium]|nr:signal peptidase II [Clostridia bacterium]
MISYILALIVGAVVLAVDQYTKYFIMTNFELGQGTDFIKGIIDIVYIHNKGGAWGILEGHTWGLLAMTVVIMLVCIALLFKWGANNKLIFWAMSLVLFGGIGNLIDRIFRDGNVVDFLHFEFWPTFPVFNVADCAIVIGVALLILYFTVDTVKELKSKMSANPIKVAENDNTDKNV